MPDPRRAKDRDQEHDIPGAAVRQISPVRAVENKVLNSLLEIHDPVRHASGCADLRGLALVYGSYAVYASIE